MTEDDRPIRRLGDEALEASRAGDPVACELPHTCPHIRCDGGDGVVVVRLDPEDPRRLRRPEPGGLGRSKRDRDLPKDVTGPTLADHALHAVDEPDRFDPALEQPEERGPVSLVHRKRSNADADVCRDPTEPLPIGRLEALEDRDSPDLVRRHHGRLSTDATLPRRATRCRSSLASREGCQSSTSAFWGTAGHGSCSSACSSASACGDHSARVYA